MERRLERLSLDLKDLQIFARAAELQAFRRLRPRFAYRNRQRAGRSCGSRSVTAPLTFGRAFVAPLLPEFLDRHPEIRMALELTPGGVDPVGSDADVAIRVGPLGDSRLRARKLGRALAPKVRAFVAFLVERLRVRVLDRETALADGLDDLVG